MAGDKFSKSVSMQCSTCGRTQFERETDVGPFRCVGCNRSFTREELMRENGELIDNEVGKMAADVGQWAQDELRKAFSSSKHFKLK
ncbi:hypothetical protein U8326_10010 [Tsuneonella sp. CC-YZS046]|uniref:ECs_2282 family putative zinc-binding protein n=1 Tax=Tsuneonella sp. CC-YZS046 TaxID=3042152 RepID=UPI002D775BEE|nr:hypothetical protein [Tsuneonella sp. CC-YZS046]WRO65395.1 hypothetical protein U8326_10010 [Tsuneonella sp. CC-YZS046]